jgi:ABC-2 type transport system permease protein
MAHGHPQVYGGGGMSILAEIRTYLAILQTTLAARMAYRGDFFISAFMIVIGDFLVPLITLMIYATGAAFPGWNMYEALLIQAIFMLAKGVAFPCFFGLVWNTLDRVRDGTFDILLLKPRSALYMTLVTGFQTDSIGRLCGGIILFIYTLFHLPAPGPFQWLLFILLFMISLIVLFGFALFMSGIVFLWVGSSRVYEIFDAVSSFGLYPRSIFTKSFQSLVTFVIPVIMIGSMPAAALLGRSTGDIWIAAICSITFCMIGLVFWHRMLGKYTSAGG